MSFENLIEHCTTPRNFDKWNNYYSGESRLDALGVSLPPDVRVLEMAAMWPKLAVDVLVESLVLEGFSTAEGDVSEELRKTFQANNFDTLWPLAMADAMVQGRSFVVIGPGQDDIPKLSAHSAKSIYTRRNIMGTVIEAVQRFRSGEDEFAVHYEPGQITQYVESRGRWMQVAKPQQSGYAGVPIVPVENRIRLGGEVHSEISDIAKLCDAASRSLTNLQVAQELLAMPMRYLFGDGADEEKLDQNGRRVSQIQAYFGRFLTGPAGSTAGQIPGADLQQIISTFKLYAQQVSAMTGIPPFMMGISADSNPSSAEAMRSAKDRLINRAMVKQNLFGDAAEQIARITLQMQGEDISGLETLESRWRDPAVASVSSRNALMLQAHAQGLISGETARESLGLTPEQLSRELRIEQANRSSIGG